MLEVIRLRSEIHKLVNSTWSKVELADKWKEDMPCKFTRTAIELIVAVTWNIAYQLHKKILSDGLFPQG
jgi:hypothetical protein